MIRGGAIVLVALLSLPVLAAGPAASEQAAAVRGEHALVSRAFLPAAWPMSAYHQAWQQWPEQHHKPHDYARLFADHYGLHPAPYPNEGLPMGLRTVQGLFGKGLTNDCMLCHGGSILGKSYVGLGNASLDFQALWEDMNGASARRPHTPFIFSNVRGTTEAGSMAVFLLSLRTADLRLRLPPVDLGLQTNLCEDVPAWWLLKKKKTMYYTGSANARSVRPLMQFMLNPLNGPAVFAKEEPTFRDIQAFILSLEPPKYPFPINTALAQRGEGIFRAHCARCHGTYGKDWTYPNKIVPLDVVGTDATRLHGLSERSGMYYNRSWFAHEKKGWLADEYPVRKTKGYQAPPLDGIWATAPYLHNGAVPTVYNVLNSKTRPQVFTRSYRTDAEDYDSEKLGWKVRVVTEAPETGLSAFERRKIYDTRQPGRGNTGHTFGDDLTESERMAVIEYLKTL